MRALKSKMAHSQKSIRDHARNKTHPNLDNRVISQQIEDLVKPCVYQQLAHYRCLGMRARILSLPLMLAAILTLVWRQVPSVRELICHSLITKSIFKRYVLRYAYQCLANFIHTSFRQNRYNHISSL